MTQVFSSVVGGIEEDVHNVMGDIWMTCLSIVNNIQRISTLYYKKVVWYLEEGNKNLKVNLMQYVYQAS
jgi:hypothetical protein